MLLAALLMTLRAWFHRRTTEGLASAGLHQMQRSREHLRKLPNQRSQYRWPVSTGKFGYSTPSGTYTPTSMNEVWYSKQWDNAPMPHAIFFMKDGHAIHGSYEVKHLGDAVSHGCVRIAPKNATILYDLVKKTGLENTQVVRAADMPRQANARGRVSLKSPGGSSGREKCATLTVEHTGRSSPSG